MLTWHYITRNDYLNMNEELKTADKLFFIKDTKEIFCGTDVFKDYVIVYTNEPTTNYIGRLYVDGYTLEGKIYDSGNWISVVNRARDYEIKDYISNNDIAYINYDNSTKLIIVTFVDGTVDTISMNNFIIDIVYGKSVGRFAIDYIYALSTNHNKLVDLQHYVDDIVYNQNSKNITISFVNKNNITVNIDSCIEDSDNDIVGIIITGNMFVAESVLASNEDNMIIENENTYVICKNNYNVISDNLEESAVSSITDIVNATVEDIVNTLQTSYYEFNFNLGSGHEGEIIVVDDTGTPSASGMKIGGETFTNPPTNDLVATESGVVDYVESNTIPVERIVHYAELADNENDASDTDVVSEKAFIESVKWRVIGGEAMISDDDNGGGSVSNVLLDDTLTKYGYAADAKSVGDALKDILAKVENTNEGKSAYQIAVDKGFEGSEAKWLASLVGKSAYEIAVDLGFEGSEAAWELSLHGKNGKSAYQIAVDNGFEGSEKEWLESLKNTNTSSGTTNGSGEDGKSAYQIAIDNGFEGSEKEWLESLEGEDGNDGKSAYQIAVDNNFKGSESEWLKSLEGEDGKSAYQIALDNDFEGSEEEWLESLKGKDGKSAYQLAVDSGFKGSEEEWLESLKNSNNNDNTINGNYVASINGKSGSVTLGKSDVGLNNVDNTSDMDKPVSTAQANAIDGMSNAIIANTSSSLNSHNASDSAHNDIRILISDLTLRLNTLADSDDTTLDQMSELVAIIKSNKSLIENVTTNKINVDQIVDNLTTNVSNKPLSAAQGVVLKGLIDDLNSAITAASNHANTAHAPSNAEANQNAYSKVKVGSVTLSADSKTATLTLVGNNITITPTTGTGTITISIDKDDVISALGYTPATTNTTYGVVSTSADGLAPKRDGSTTKFLRADGTWAVPPDTNTTYGVVSTSANGLAPKRDGSTTKFLRADGTWAVPPDTNTVYTHPTTAGNKHIPAGGSSGQILRWSAAGTAEWGADNNTTYSVVSTSADGLAPKRDGSTTKFLRGDGTWAVPPDTKVTVDSALSSTSTNPVQNKAVYAAINNVKSKTLTEHLAGEAMVLSSLQYGDTLPAAGTPGRIFFKRVSK